MLKNYKVYCQTLIMDYEWPGDWFKTLREVEKLKKSMIYSRIVYNKFYKNTINPSNSDQSSYIESIDRDETIDIIVTIPDKPEDFKYQIEDFGGNHFFNLKDGSGKLYSCMLKSKVDDNPIKEPSYINGVFKLSYKKI